MNGHISGYDQKREIGVILCDNKTYYFGNDAWHEEFKPYISCTVYFEIEETEVKQKHPRVTQVELVGEYQGPVGEPVKSRMVAALLSIFLGWLGAGRFYLGYTKIGIYQIIATVLTLGFLGTAWGFIEGILLLMQRIFKDAEGRPLK